MGSTSVSLRVGKQGRVVLPAALRRQAGIDEGTELVARVSDGGQIVISTPESIKARIRARAAAGSAMGGSAVDDLLAERKTDTSLLD